jgi:hypothetical protein
LAHSLLQNSRAEHRPHRRDESDAWAPGIGAPDLDTTMTFQSWFPPSSSTIARPIIPVAPTTRAVFLDVLIGMSLVQTEKGALPIDALSSTSRIWAVMKAASSDKRNAIATAISSGCPSRFMGIAAKLRRGIFHDVAELKAAIDEWIEHRNRDPKPFTWTACQNNSRQAPPSQKSSRQRGM